MILYQNERASHHRQGHDDDPEPVVQRLVVVKPCGNDVWCHSVRVSGFSVQYKEYHEYHVLSVNARIAILNQALDPSRLNCRLLSPRCRIPQCRFGCRDTRLSIVTNGLYLEKKETIRETIHEAHKYG